MLLAALTALAGCGMPGAPQAPSLNLPGPITNLSAVRTGDQVALTWKMPLRNTDKILLRGPIATRICRNQYGAAHCNGVTVLQLNPGADATYTDTLPPGLTAGLPQPLSYFVELVNRKGRSAGLSNAAEVLAGQAPETVSGFSAEVRKEGVLLRWSPASPDSQPTAIRFVRTLLSPPVKESRQGLLAAPPEPLERNLLVDSAASGRAIDSDIHFGESYEYRAQRVSRVTQNGHALELAGPLTAALRVDALDIFPPNVPQGLAAVATAGENGNPPAIDLSWQPDADSNLAGYIVYRKESGTVADGSSSVGRENTGQWQRISPAQLGIEPDFRDSKVQTGRSYLYAVSAIAKNGYESARSTPAGDTVPGP